MYGRAAVMMCGRAVVAMCGRAVVAMCGWALGGGVWPGGGAMSGRAAGW